MLTAERVGSMMLMSVVLLAGFSTVMAVEGDAAWRYQGVWTNGDTRSDLHELRLLSADGALWRAYRVMLDTDGAAFSWQNETRWLDDEGATLRMNQTMVTDEGDSWRRIGIETTYDAACAGAPMDHRPGPRECSGTRTVLGRSLPFSETVTYEVAGSEKLDATGAETTRIDATSGSSRISYWWSDTTCSSLQEEIVAGGARLLLAFVSGPDCASAGGPWGPIVDALDDAARSDASAKAGPDGASEGPTAAANDGPAPDEGEDETMESPVAPLVGAMVLLVAMLHVARRRQS